MTEYAANGTFETWLSPTNLYLWAEHLEGDGSTTINQEDTEQYAGLYCLRFDVGASKSLSKIHKVVNLTPDNSYLLSFWYKGSESSGTLLHCGLINVGDAYWLDDDGEWKTIGSYDGGFTVDHTTTWAQKTLIFTALAPHTSFDFTIKNCSHGDGVANCEVYVDNLSISDNISHETTNLHFDTNPNYDSVSVKDNFEYYLTSSVGKVYEYSPNHLSDDGDVIVCRWESKVLDFADQVPECEDAFKAIKQIKIYYEDLTADIDLTVYVSNDGGKTFDWKTRTIGEGNGFVKTASFFFNMSGQFFQIIIEHASTNKEFTWLGAEIDVEPLGSYVELA